MLDTTTDQNMVASTTLSNKLTLDTVLKEARAWGKLKAKGDDSIVMLAHRVIQASNEGTIDLTKDKHGDGVDDAALIYNTYAEGRTDAATHEKNPGSVKAQKSKVRRFVKGGQLTAVDPIQLRDECQLYHSEMQAAGEDIKGAYQALYDVFGKQLEQPDQQLTEGEIKDICRKAEKPSPELEKMVEAMMKRVDKIVSGEIGGGVKDQGEQALAVQDTLRTWHKTLAYVSEQTAAAQALADAQARAAAAGVAV